MPTPMKEGVQRGKACKRCGGDQWFERARGGDRTGSEWACRQCSRQRSRDYHAGNRERILLSNARSRAVRQGVDFHLELGDIIIPARCPILNIPLVHGERGKFSDYSPTLDRINPARGYVPDNVIVLSFRANTIKNNATPEELTKVAEWLRATSKGVTYAGTSSVYVREHAGSGGGPAEHRVTVPVTAPERREHGGRRDRAAGRGAGNLDGLLD